MDAPHAFQQYDHFGSFVIYGTVLNRGLKMFTHGTYPHPGYPGPDMRDTLLEINVHSPNPSRGLYFKETEDDFINVFNEIKDILDIHKEPGDYSLIHDGSCHPIIHLTRNLFRVRTSSDATARRRSLRNAHSLDTWAVRPEYEHVMQDTLQHYALNPVTVLQQADSSEVPYPPVFLQSRLPEAFIRVDFDLHRIRYPSPRNRGILNPFFTSWAGVMNTIKLMD